MDKLKKLEEFEIEEINKINLEKELKLIEDEYKKSIQKDIENIINENLEPMEEINEIITLKKKKASIIQNEKNEKNNNNKEIIEEIKNEPQPNNLKDFEILEITDKYYPINQKIYNIIKYEKNEFILDIKQTKNYPSIINYRCRYFRKEQHINNKYFCKAMIKRKIINKQIQYELIKDHSDVCRKFIKK